VQARKLVAGTAHLSGAGERNWLHFMASRTMKKNEMILQEQAIKVLSILSLFLATLQVHQAKPVSQDKQYLELARPSLRLLQMEDHPVYRV